MSSHTVPVHILAAESTKTGELWHISPRDLVTEVVRGAVKYAHCRMKDIQALFVGNMLSSVLGGQDHLGALFSEELRLFVPAMKIEGACASGGLALHAGFLAVSSGQYDTVLVVGVEKMTDHPPEAVVSALTGAGEDAERESGATFSSLYALIARSHMERYRTTTEDMARVSVKNHYHATLNPRAHFHSLITVADVLSSPMISSPLRLLDCSPISDGAAAVILSRKKTLIPRQRSVCLRASAVATDSIGLAQRRDITELSATVTAGKTAYDRAGIGVGDIDVLEVHDCFSIAEILALEDLGFAQKGEVGKLLSAKQTTVGGSGPIVNTSGGLKASGHPVGATGVKQAVEIFCQLRGDAGARQVEHATAGLTHNVGGTGGTAVVHIFTV